MFVKPNQAVMECHGTVSLMFWTTVDTEQQPGAVL